MTPDETAGITGLLDAISHYLGPRQDINLACAAVCGCGLSPASVAEFTTLLGGPPAPRFTPACQSCGNTLDLDAVHRRAEEGIAGRVEYWCHDTAACWRNRHPAATPAGAA